MWIKSAVVDVASEITKHGTINDEFEIDSHRADPNIAAHVASTDANEYLPEGFVQELIKNKPDWWIQRYIYSSFSFAEGLVYPKAMRCVVQSFEVPSSWKRIVAHDYGLSDPSTFIFGAVDEEHGEVHIYKEIRLEDANIETLANAFLDAAKNIPPGMWISQPIIDPKSGPKRDYNKKSLLDLYADYNIFFKPGAVSVDARVFRTKTYTDLGKVKIHDCCTYLIDELKNYKYPERKIGEPVKDKPVDKNNHSINAMEWILMELPADPSKLLHGIYNSKGYNLVEPLKPSVPWDNDGPQYYDSFNDDLAFGIDFRNIY